MDGPNSSELLGRLVGQVVVVDLRSTYVCLGKLAAGDLNARVPARRETKPVTRRGEA